MINPNYENFLAALEALCKEHGVLIATSGYDMLQVWKLAEGEVPIHPKCIQDMTKPGAGLS